MKRIVTVLILFAVMALGVQGLPEVWAHAAGLTACALYAGTEDGEAAEPYYADFGKTVVITLMDVPRYGELRLVDCEPQARAGAARQVWDHWDWSLGKNFETAQSYAEDGEEKITSAFKAVLPDEDYSPALTRHDAPVNAVFRIRPLGLRSFDSITLQYSAGDTPEKEQLWQGKLMKAGSDTPQDEVVQNITLSQVQLSADGGEWQAELSAEANPAEVRVRTVDGLSVIGREDYSDALSEDVAAKRWVGGWPGEDEEEPFVLYALKGVTSGANPWPGVHAAEPYTVYEDRDGDGDVIYRAVSGEAEGLRENAWGGVGGGSKKRGSTEKKEQKSTGTGPTGRRSGSGSGSSGSGDSGSGSSGSGSSGSGGDSGSGGGSSAPGFTGGTSDSGSGGKKKPGNNSGDTAPVAPKPLELSLETRDADGNKVHIDLVEEKDGALALAEGVGGVCRLAPGEYYFRYSGGSSPKYKFCAYGDEEAADSKFANINWEKKLTVEAGKRYTLVIQQGKQEAPAVTIEGLIVEPVTIDEQPSLPINGNTVGDGLAFTGTAQSGVELKWTLLLDGKEVKSGECVSGGTVAAPEEISEEETAGTEEAPEEETDETEKVPEEETDDTEEVPEEEIAVTEEASEEDVEASEEVIVAPEATPSPEGGENRWSVPLSLDDPALQGVEGTLRFEIGYVEADLVGVPESSNREAPRASDKWETLIDTRGPELSMAVSYGGGAPVALTPEQPSAVFVKREGAALTVRYGEKDAEPEAFEIGTDEPPKGLEIREDPAGTYGLRYSVTDEAGNTGTVAGAVRLVAPIEYARATLDGKPFEPGAWINVAALGGRIAVEGSAEPGEALKWRFQPDGETHEAKADEKGRWQTEPMTLEEAALDDADALALEVWYADEGLNGAQGTVTAGSWLIDVVPPEAPALSADVADVTAWQRTGDAVKLTVEVPEDAELASLTRNGEAVEPENGQYSFEIPGGETAFVATAEDAAGNRTLSEPLTLTAHGKIDISLPDSIAGKETLNARDLEKGLALDIRWDHDVGDDGLDIHCHVTGPDGAAEFTEGALSRDGNTWTMDPQLLERPRNAGPVEIELRADYRQQPGEKTLGGSWTGTVDVWLPEVRIDNFTTWGIGDKAMFYDGDDIAVVVQGDVPAESIEVTGNGANATPMSEAEFSAFAASESRWTGDHNGVFLQDKAPAEGDYFRLKGAAADARGELDIVATAVDAAGNVSTDSIRLTRYSQAEAIKVEKAIQPLTKSSTITVEGKAMKNYRLVCRELPHREIAVSSTGKWSLDLNSDDVPEEAVEAGEWKLTLEYPGEFYNAGDPCVVSVPVDMTCALKWREDRMPAVYDRFLAVDTEAGATVTLRSGMGEVLATKVAEAGGTVSLDLPEGEYVTRDSTYEISAVDKSGNPSVTLYVRDCVGDPVYTRIGLDTLTQTGRDTLDIVGTAKPMTKVAVTVDGKTTVEAEVNENGQFRLEGVQADGGEGVVTAAYLNLSGEDAESTKAEGAYTMDRQAPKLSVAPDRLDDLGGEVTVETEPGASVRFTGVALESVLADDKGRATVVLEGLRGVERVEVTAADEFGNESEPAVIGITATDPLKAGFDKPEAGEELSGEGTTSVTGWVVSADEAQPEGLTLTVGTDAPVPLALIRDDERLKDAAFLEALGKMNPASCWRFEQPLEMKGRPKGEIHLELRQDDRVLDGRDATVVVDKGKMTLYIVLSALSAALLAVCVAMIVLISKRIKRAEAGKVNPASGTTQLTERNTRDGEGE